MRSLVHNASFSMPRSLRTKSVETLSPAHGDLSRTTPVTSSATALLSTMMGGMLTIPRVLARGSSAALFVLASAVAGGFSLYILIAAARRTGACCAATSRSISGRGQGWPCRS